MNSVRFSLVALGIALCFLPMNAAQNSTPQAEKIRDIIRQREIISLDYNWRFRQGDQQVGFNWLKAVSFGGPVGIDYPDSTWRKVIFPMILWLKVLLPIPLRFSTGPSPEI